MKTSHHFITCFLAGSSLLAGRAEAVDRTDFSNSLRRAVAVSGVQEQRFRLRDRMDHYRVPGVSVAIIQDCRIVESRGFGTARPNGPPVTGRTLFQAGSISKTFTAVAVLRLVERGALSLDGDVRQHLTSWRLPDSPLLAGGRVTLRGLLTHTAGINQEGGVGYSRNVPLPSLHDILEGRPPANTAPIRLASTPGVWRYSGGGYYITQALMQDATGVAYPQLMQRLVFRQLGMGNSSFSQPLHRRHLPAAAHAAGPDGEPLEGGWRVNPELAAGGLWTTSSDVARLIVAVARAVRGGPGRFPRAGRRPRDMARDRGVGALASIWDQPAGQGVSAIPGTMSATRLNSSCIPTPARARS